MIDAALHYERMAGQRETPRYCDTLRDLPDGTFITADEQHAYLTQQGRLWHWSPTGYTSYEPANLQFPARILTPASLIRTLAAGYPIAIHGTAQALSA